MPPRRSRFPAWFAAAVLLALIAAATHSYWLAALGGWLVAAESPFQADAVVVLAGDRFGRRILKGAELVRQGFAPLAVKENHPCAGPQPQHHQQVMGGVRIQGHLRTQPVRRRHQTPRDHDRSRSSGSVAVRRRFANFLARSANSRHRG